MTEPASVDPAAVANVRARAYFRSDATRPHDFRLAKLHRLKEVIEAYEPRILEAMMSDLGKPPMEAFASEIGVVLKDLNLAIRSLRSWMKPRRASSNLMLMPASSELVPEPLGVALVMAPWNYPMNLFIGPLVGAIAAGCTAVMKPSEQAPATGKLMQEMLKEAFGDDGYVQLLQGGPELGDRLLEQKWDVIFFTGSTRVGKRVMAAAAKHLTPCVLELGGKNAVLVDEDVDLAVAARRILWAKTYNAGQTCVTADYVLVHKSVKDALVEHLVATLKQFFGDDPRKSKELGRIVSAHHVRRLKSLLTGGRVVAGGECDEAERYFAPTIVVDPAMDSPLMQEEIFGPILPVAAVDSWSEAVRIVRDHSRPLCVYAFTSNPAHAEEVERYTSSGALMFNETVLHFVNEGTPFGGVGDSGMGGYHGKYSFEAFTHLKPVIRKSTLFDGLTSFRYPGSMGPMWKFKWLLR